MAATAGRSDETMSAARARVKGRSSSWGTTWLTSPQARAWPASMKLPVAVISRARRRPTAWGRVTVSPHRGWTPMRAWVSAKRARSEATRKSQLRANSRPPVTATPLMAPMIGLAVGRVPRRT